MAPGPDPLLGVKLGSYEIIEAIGEGGMARIYKGVHAELKRYAAIKVVHWGLQEDPAFTDRFRREAQAIASLRHPNVVQIFDFGQHGSGYFMVMEFIDGSDLAVILQQARDKGQLLPPTHIVRIISEIAAALDYAHHRRVIHRDVKPSNIMLNREGQAILTDFGLVMLPAKASQATIGNTFGTPHYIAPEQAISSAAAVPASDLYALGVVLFEMATGQVPFDDGSLLSVALKHVNEMPPLPSAINPNISAELEAVILKALAKAPADRFQSGHELAAAVEAAFKLEAGLTVSGPMSAAITTRGVAAHASTAIAPPPAPPGAGPAPSPAPEEFGATIPVRPHAPEKAASLPGWAVIILVGLVSGLVGASGLFLFNRPDPAPTPGATSGMTALAANATQTVTPTASLPPAAAVDPPATPTPAPTDTAAPTVAPPPETATPTPSATPTPEVTLTPTATPAAASPTPTPTETPVASPTAAPASVAGKILFKTDRAGLVEIYQMEADGSNQRPFADQALYTALQADLPASPDGTSRIVVRTSEGQPDLWWANSSTGIDLRVVGTIHPEYDPAWAPVGNRIAYVSDETGASDIYLLNLDGSPAERLTINENNFDKHPTWSPDGNTIVYWSDMGLSRNRQIYALNLSSRQPANLSDNPFNDWDPVWVWE